MRHRTRTALLLALVVTLAPVVVLAGEVKPGAKAVARVMPLGGSKVGGTIVFRQLDHGVEITADITGLSPGAHGFHVHEFGDCSAPDGTSAGPHFNPGGAPHAGPDASAAHAGDYGNLVADAQGHATLKLVSHRIAVGTGPEGVVGRSVIVHEKEDDLVSQPTGNAGGRIGCGLIELEGGATVPVRKP